jgi:hypothetical protein
LLFSFRAPTAGGGRKGGMSMPRLRTKRGAGAEGGRPSAITFAPATGSPKVFCRANIGLQLLDAFGFLSLRRTCNDALGFGGARHMSGSRQLALLRPGTIRSGGGSEAPSPPTPRQQLVAPTNRLVWLAAAGVLARFADVAVSIPSDTTLSRSIRFFLTKFAHAGKKRLRTDGEAPLPHPPTETSRRPTHPTAVSEPHFPSPDLPACLPWATFFLRFLEISLAAFFSESQRRSLFPISQSL